MAVLPRQGHPWPFMVRDSKRADSVAQATAAMIELTSQHFITEHPPCKDLSDRVLRQGKSRLPAITRLKRAISEEHRERADKPAYRYWFEECADIDPEAYRRIQTRGDQWARSPVAAAVYQAITSSD